MADVASTAATCDTTYYDNALDSDDEVVADVDGDRQATSTMSARSVTDPDEAHSTSCVSESLASFHEPLDAMEPCDAARENLTAFESESFPVSVENVPVPRYDQLACCSSDAVENPMEVIFDLCFILCFVTVECKNVLM